MIESFYNDPDEEIFNSTHLEKYSINPIQNNYIIEDIKDSYEQFISDIDKLKISFLKKKYKEKKWII